MSNKFRRVMTFDLVLAGAIKYTRCSRDVHLEVESHGQSKHMTSFPVKCKHIMLSFPYKVKVKGQRWDLPQNPLQHNYSWFYIYTGCTQVVTHNHYSRSKQQLLPN